MKNPLAAIRDLFWRSGSRRADFVSVGFDEGGPARKLVPVADERDDSAEQGPSLHVTDEEREALLGGAEPEPSPIAGTLSVSEPAAPSPADAREELAYLLGGIRDGLDAQHERQEQLVGRFEGLPEFLTSVPEQIERANRRSDELAEQLKALPEVLAAIPSAAQAQTQMLRQVIDQTAAQTVQGQRMVDTLEGVRLCLRDMSQGAARQIQCLEKMETARQSDTRQLAQAIHDQGRRTAAMYVTLVALGALAVAGVVVIGSLVSRLL